MRDSRCRHTRVPYTYSHRICRFCCACLWPDCAACVHRRHARRRSCATAGFPVSYMQPRENCASGSPSSAADAYHAAACASLREVPIPSSWRTPISYMARGSPLRALRAHLRRLRNRNGSEDWGCLGDGWHFRRCVREDGRHDLVLDRSSSRSSGMMPRGTSLTTPPACRGSRAACKSLPERLQRAVQTRLPSWRSTFDPWRRITGAGFGMNRGLETAHRQRRTRAEGTAMAMVPKCCCDSAVRMRVEKQKWKAACASLARRRQKRQGKEEARHAFEVPAACVHFGCLVCRQLGATAV